MGTSPSDTPSRGDDGTCLSQALSGFTSLLRCLINDEKPEKLPLQAVPTEPIVVPEHRSLVLSPEVVAYAYSIEAGTRQTVLEIQNAKRLFDRFVLGEPLGTGAYGKVSLAKGKKKSGVRYAVKSIPISKFESDCKDELNIAWELAHPHIAFVHEAFQDRSTVYIMMEVCSGGTFTQLVKRRPKALPYSLVTSYARQMISAIAYMHHHRFVHRDIKPSNFMLQDTVNDCPVKLIDMGFACRISTGVRLTARIGTAECSAPEVIRGSYDEKCDVWSLGIVLYYCCVGSCPFQNDDAAEVCRQVLDNKPNFESECWTQDGHAMRLLVRDMLTKSPGRRPSSRQVANANAGWLGTPAPEPCFANMPSISKESSKESLLSHASRQSRGQTTSKETSSADSSGSPSPLPKGITKLLKGRRKSTSSSKSEEDLPNAVGEKKKSRRSSKFLSQVKRLSLSSLVSTSKMAG